MYASLLIPIRPGVWTLGANQRPEAELLVDGFPTDEWYDRPDVQAHYDWLAGR